MNIVSAVFLSFLPKRYRDVFTPFEVPSAGSIIGGFLELFLCLGLLIRSYDTFMNDRLAATSLLLMEKAAEKGGESAVASLGGFALIDFLFRITTIVLAVFILEGLVRVIAAIRTRDRPYTPSEDPGICTGSTQRPTKRTQHGRAHPR
jgi:hypothetical protein